MKSDRRPVYHDKVSGIRIVSRPNGLWAVQTRTTTDGKGTIDSDPWQDFVGASRLSYDQARLRLETEATIKH